tara:strand:+ start:705 stop:1175 length:471 start_codon:yes stop_codon:yes gene_type:complete
MLYIKIIGLNSDAPSNWFTRNDLYVKINYDEQLRRTTTLWNINNPIWNEGFIFDDCGTKSVYFEIYDENTWNKPELISKFEINNYTDHIRQITQNNLTFEIGKIFNEYNILVDSLKSANAELTDKNNLLLEQNDLQKSLTVEYKRQINEIKQILYV